jgi:Protein of unknown function (DUF3105)
VAKKKRKRPYTPPQTRVEDAAPAPEAPKARGISPASVARRDRKEEARRQREAIMRRTRRAEILRRVIIWGVVVLGIAAVVLFFVFRAGQRTRLVDRAREIAEATNCTQPVQEADQGNAHENVGTPIEYSPEPPSSGTHWPVTLASEFGDQHIFEQAPDIPIAVHSLEHGWVIIWYRAEGDRALPDDIVNALEGVADQSEVALIPYPEPPDDMDLAFTSWRMRQTCRVDPAGGSEDRELTADDATTLARAFIEQFRNSTLAPEAPAA